MVEVVEWGMEVVAAWGLEQGGGGMGDIMTVKAGTSSRAWGVEGDTSQPTCSEYNHVRSMALPVTR